MRLTDASRVATTLISEHLGEDWSFRFDNAKTSFGSCHEAERRITLSRHLVVLNDEALVIDTLLHEIAHGKAGVRAGHGKKWKAWAIALGAAPTRCIHDGVLLPAKPWLGRCPRCQRTISRYRRSNAACTVCCNALNGGYWSKEFRYIWEPSEQSPSDRGIAIPDGARRTSSEAELVTATESSGQGNSD